MKTILIIVSIEVLLSMIYWIMRLYKKNKFKSIIIPLTKGWLERAFICFGLLIELQIVIIFFSALKLGTRLNDDNPSKVSNDQFLIGNILSLTAAIIYSQVLTNII